MPMRRLSDICKNQHLVSVTPGTTVREAARRMADAHVGTVLVIEQGQLKGILSERDFVQRIVAESRDPDTTLTAEVMTPKPYGLDGRKTGLNALALMHEHGIRHIAVTGLEGEGFGVVSIRDFVSAELHAAEEVEAQKQELWEHV
ncbi:MAG: CBS domain-containing protein [Magnetovibrionaceae bacterium]